MEDTFLDSKWEKRVTLFNIDQDPLELNDLSDSRKDIVELMLKKLEGIATLKKVLRFFIFSESF